MHNVLDGFSAHNFTIETGRWNLLGLHIEENVVAPSRYNTIASVPAGAEGLCKDGMLVISPISISSF